MKSLSLTFLCFFFSLFLFASKGKVVIRGHVENSSSSTIKITHLSNQKLVETKVGEDGHFKMNAKIEDGYYLLTYGRSTAYIYLHPKDKLIMNFDANDFETTLTFNGKGAERNNYLAKKALLYSKLTEDVAKFYKVSEEQYVENLKNVSVSYTSLLSNYTVEDFFSVEEKKSMKYERLLGIQNYKNSYKFYLGEEIVPSSKFYQPIDDIDLGNNTDYNKQPYYRYLVNSVWSKKIEAEPNANAMLAKLRKVPSKDVAISLTNGFFSKISSNKERAKDYLDLIKMVTTNKPFIEAAEKQYVEVMVSDKLVKGDISPSFTYESVNGEMISLDDLKGKYVYIDIWATWCAPCIKQVPYLQELEEQYHDKNIVFVSISVDKESAKPKWKKMIEEKQLVGIQLFADNSFDSEFIAAYGINLIPRFILIDPQGKIVEAEAPSPSFERTKVLLDELLQ